MGKVDFFYVHKNSHLSHRYRTRSPNVFFFSYRRDSHSSHSRLSRFDCITISIPVALQAEPVIISLLPNLSHLPLILPFFFSWSCHHLIIISSSTPMKEKLGRSPACLLESEYYTSYDAWTTHKQPLPALRRLLFLHYPALSAHLSQRKTSLRKMFQYVVYFYEVGEGGRDAWVGPFEII